MTLCRQAISLVSALLISAAAYAQGTVSLASTLQGTDSDKTLSHGCTFPNTVMPQGTHAWSPRTRNYGESEKYVWSDSSIKGFDLTHQCNMWMRDYDVLTLMPELGPAVYDIDERAVTFSHKDEVAWPHYYKVSLSNGIKVEIAPTERCAHLRFTYPKGKGTPRLILDGNTGTSEFEIDGKSREIRGWVLNEFWDNPSKSMKCWFVIRFDRPLTDYEIIDGKASVAFSGATSVQARIACSFISLEQAGITFGREIASDRSLEQTKSKGAAAWNERLGRIAVSGGTEEQRRTFYSCLYRANCFPRILHEYDAQGDPRYFSPYDGRIHEGYMYADVGLWDAYHSLMPLYCLTNPDGHGKYVASYADIAEQGGWLPAWSSPGESGMMTGNHAISVLADAWAKGIRTFDPGRVLDCYLHDATNKGSVMDAVGRPEWQDYFTLGYVPVDKDRGCSASKTLEYAYDDWCAWKLATDTGNASKADIFGRQTGNWRNVFDPETGFMRGKDRDGRWAEPFDPRAWDGYFAFESRDYCEGNAWQWTWAVNHDFRGLMDAFGSEQNFISKLDSVFSQSPTKPYGRWAELKENDMMDVTAVPLGQYVHGNEPIHHLPYLYDWVGQPWKTQRLVRTIMDGLYSSGPQGFPGDEDQGAMSSWYVLSAAGLYCVTPGTDQYAIGSPLFEKVVIKNGDKEFTVLADGNSKENVYIQKAELNGRALDRNWISHSEIISGGTLHLVMGPEPCKTRGTSAACAPYSASDSPVSARFSPLECVFDGPEYNPATQYRNPILPGFYPDPSICRSGDDYYMVNSTFQYFPAIPVWHSTDLVHWEQCGSVLDTDAKIPLEKSMMLWGIFAPQISYNPHDGRFYVICTQVGGTLGNFFCTSDNPMEGGWTDPVRLPEVEGIDPSIFFDDDGRAWITSAAGPEYAGGTRNYDGDGAILMWEFDWKNGRTVGKPRIAAQSGIHPEQEPKSFEGPHIYKIDGKYFLMCAEGGTELNHSEVLLEADNILDTFKPCSINPILTQRDLHADRKNPVSCTGHADLVRTAGGKWYAVFLGCQPYEGLEIFNTGRQTFLLPVTWTDGQPVILPKGESVPLIVDMDDELRTLAAAGKMKGFDGLNPGPLWSADGPAPFALSARGSVNSYCKFNPDGTLDLKCAGVPLDICDTPAALFQRISGTTFRAQTTLEFNPSGGSEAGLICWHDDDHFMKLTKRLDESGRPVLRLEERGTDPRTELYCLIISRIPSRILYSVDIPLDKDSAECPLILMVEARDARTYAFSYAVRPSDGSAPQFRQIGQPLDGSMPQFRQVGQPLDGLHLSTMNCAGFQGAMIGVFAY